MLDVAYADCRNEFCTNVKRKKKHDAVDDDSRFLL